jgi:hypothetical protein
LTPNAKFNAYVNYDYGQNRIPKYSYNNGDGTTTVKSMDPHWQGVAFSARGQVTPNAALVVRYEDYWDNQGFTTGQAVAADYSGDILDSTAYFKENIEEITATYEYKWVAKTSQNTATVGMIAFFGPKR